MAQPSAQIVGRSVPAWLGQALWSLVPIAALSVVLQLENLPAVATSPEAAPMATNATQVAERRARQAPSPVMLRLDRPMRHGDFVWSDEGVPPGHVDILVDIPTQTLHVFRSGYEIGRAVILYGTDEDPTPLGSFTITEKDADHESNIYEAAMPYMMRLTNDGIAIHGAVVEYGKASRGCVGVPDEFAALLFAQARIGDRVRIVDNRAADASASTRS